MDVVYFPYVVSLEDALSHLKTLFVLGYDPTDVALAIVLMEIRSGKKYKELNDNILNDLTLIYTFILEEMWAFFGIDTSDDPKVWSQKYDEIRRDLCNSCKGIICA